MRRSLPIVGVLAALVGAMLLATPASAAPKGAAAQRLEPLDHLAGGAWLAAAWVMALTSSRAGTPLRR
jgi:hypothetical protein